MILSAIVACEIGFWVAILAGLAFRYLAKKPRLGAAFLIGAPLIDLLLLGLVAADLMAGGTASWHHGLAALYIGISVAYGHRMIAWADRQFAQRFAGAPPQPKLTGMAYTILCWKDVARTFVAVTIAALILLALIWIVNAPARTAELNSTFQLLALILGIDVLWALSYTIWPKKPTPTR